MNRWFRRREKPLDDPQQWAAISARIAEDREQRQRQLVGREPFVQRLETLLFGHDPIVLNSEFNKDEYRAEAETITLLLSEATNQGDAQRIIHEEFVRCFDAQLAGPPERYTAIASETWSDWIAFTNRTGG